MSIQARMVNYPILEYKKTQSSTTGRVTYEWRHTGQTVRGAFYSGQSAEQTQSVFYRSLSAYLLTLGRPDIDRDKNRIRINGEDYDVGDICPQSPRYTKIELKAAKERDR